MKRAALLVAITIITFSLLGSLAFAGKNTTKVKATPQTVMSKQQAKLASKSQHLKIALPMIKAKQTTSVAAADSASNDSGNLEFGVEISNDLYRDDDCGRWYFETEIWADGDGLWPDMITSVSFNGGKYVPVSPVTPQYTAESSSDIPFYMENEGRSEFNTTVGGYDKPGTYRVKAQFGDQATITPSAFEIAPLYLVYNEDTKESGDNAIVSVAAANLFLDKLPSKLSVKVGGKDYTGKFVTLNARTNYPTPAYQFTLPKSELEKLVKTQETSDQPTTFLVNVLNRTWTSTVWLWK